jgi:hypothetical protein
MAVITASGSDLGLAGMVTKRTLEAHRAVFHLSLVAGVAAGVRVVGRVAVPTCYIRIETFLVFEWMKKGCSRRGFD